MIDLVQSAKPLTYAAMHEGLLVADEPRQMVAGTTRSQPYRQVMVSAEARSRVELWREYVSPAGVEFSAASCDAPGWFVGDDAGNLHYSYDGLSWTISKKFSAEVTGVNYDGMEEPWLWVSTAGGEIWRASQAAPGGAWTWELSYSDPAVAFAGIGISDRQIVGVIYASKNIVQSTNLNGGPWTVLEVFEKNLYGWGCFTDEDAGELWYASYETKPRYSSDGGATWTQTSGAAGNAIADICKHNGTIVAVGPGGAWRSVDDGATWAQVISVSPSNVRGICGGPSGWAAVGPHGLIYVSDDDGVTWTPTTACAEGRDSTENHGVGVAIHYEQANGASMLALFQGVVMISFDSGVTWTAGTGGEPWRISVEEYQPVLLDLPYEVPVNQRLVGKASEETFVLVGG